MIIAHVSQYLTISDPAFAHAVALAARSGAAVRGIHVGRCRASEPSPPGPRALLTRWGMSGVALDHAWRVSPSAGDVADAVLELIGQVQPELLVASSHVHSGLERLFAGSVVEAVARNSNVPVLILPHEGPFLVSAQSGAIRLERALLLAGTSQDTQRAAEGLVLLGKLARLSPGSVELLHVEDGTPEPHPVLPPGFDVIHYRARGPIERAVAERVARYEPQLVVMTSHGHDQLSDILFSSHTERVLHEIRRPLLWVPAQRAA